MSEVGNRYVLMVIDQFSLWLEVLALNIQDAETLARVFYETYTVRFGMPFVIHTEQGHNFDSILKNAFVSY